MTQEVKTLIGIGLATLVVLIAGVFLLSKQPGTETAEEVGVQTLLGAETYTKGSKDAKVTLVEFADFQCPACAAVNPILNEIVESNGDKIYFVYRHFPLPQHKNAVIAAEAAEAAGEQGKFWEMKDLLYGYQTDWSEKGDPMDMFTTYAQKLELDIDGFTEAVESGKYKEMISKGYSDGVAAGANSTPTIFLNGTKYSGLMTKEALQSAIDTAMKEE